MATLESLSAQPQTHRIIIYGSPGSGKTWAIGRLAESHNLYYFSLENGYRTLLNPECVAPEFRKNIQIIQMLDTPETPIAATSLDSFFRNGKGSFCESHGRNDCPLCKRSGDPFLDIEISKLGAKDILIFDSLTQWENSITFSLVGKDSDAKGDYEYWRKLALHLSRSLSRIQLINNCSVIVISHEAGIETVAGQDRIVPAGGSKNFARSNARFFDGAYYAYKENKRHRLASASTFSNIIDTKDRSAFDTSQFRDPRNALFVLFNPDKKEQILAEENPKGSK